MATPEDYNNCQLENDLCSAQTTASTIPRDSPNLLISPETDSNKLQGGMSWQKQSQAIPFENKHEQSNQEDNLATQLPLEQLTLNKTLFISESYTPNKYSVSSNMLRKNYENFVLIKQKNCVVAPGPKKVKDQPRGLVIAYNSGYIVSCSTRDQVSIKTTNTIDPISGATNPPLQTYADWIRKKFRSHDAEPLCANNGFTRPITVCSRADIPYPFIIFLEELHDFLQMHFPHWLIVYDPEIYPYMAVCRNTDAASMGSDMLRTNSRSTSEPYKRSSSISPLILPNPSSHKHLWPNTSVIESFKQRDTFAMNSKHSYLSCIYIIGQRYVLLHNVKAQEDIHAAVDDIWDIVKYFVGTQDTRFSNRTDETKSS